MRHENNLTMPEEKGLYNFFPLKIQLGCNESFFCQKREKKKRKNKRVKKDKEKEKREKESIQHQSPLKDLGILTIQSLCCFHQS